MCVSSSMRNMLFTAASTSLHESTFQAEVRSLKTTLKEVNNHLPRGRRCAALNRITLSTCTSNRAINASETREKFAFYRQFAQHNVLLRHKTNKVVDVVQPFDFSIFCKISLIKRDETKQTSNKKKNDTMRDDRFLHPTPLFSVMLEINVRFLSHCLQTRVG